MQERGGEELNDRTGVGARAREQLEALGEELALEGHRLGARRRLGRGAGPAGELGLPRAAGEPGQRRGALGHRAEPHQVGEFTDATVDVGVGARVGGEGRLAAAREIALDEALDATPAAPAQQRERPLERAGRAVLEPRSAAKLLERVDRQPYS